MSEDTARLREAASVISELLASTMLPKLEEWPGPNKMMNPDIKWKPFLYDWERQGLRWLAVQVADDPDTTINMWTAQFLPGGNRYEDWMHQP